LDEGRLARPVTDHVRDRNDRVPGSGDDRDPKEPVERAEKPITSCGAGTAEDEVVIPREDLQQDR